MNDAPERPKFFSLRLLVTSFLAIVAALVYAGSMGIFSCGETGLVFALIANGLTIPGVVFTGFSALIFAKRHGAFDGLAYSARYTLGTLVPQFWLSRSETAGKRIPFADYCAEKRKKEKQNPGHAAVYFAVGGVCLLLAIVFNVAVAVWFPETVIP